MSRAAARRARRTPQVADAIVCRAQAKSKSTQLQEAIAAAINDRDELQKKYEAKSRYAPTPVAAQADLR